jgi:hypothetical protein
MSASDWLTPMDDALCARLRTCTVCGARPGHHGWFDIWTGAGLAVAVLLCARCRAADPKHHTLSALIQRRYGVESKDGPGSAIEEGGRDGQSEPS